MSLDLKSTAHVWVTRNDPDNPDMPLIVARVTGVQDKATGALLSPSAAVGQVFGVSDSLEAEMSLTMAAAGIDIEFMERDERTSLWKITGVKE